MANILIDQATMEAIADAIRQKLGETATYLPSEMPAKILSIKSGGGIPTTILYAHSPNVSDDGTISGTYANSLNYVETFTIPGAERLKIELQYSTESTSYDWICVWAGSHSDYTPSGNYGVAITPDGMSSPKIGGGSNATTFTGNTTIYVDGDSVTIGMKSDSSQGYAGYHATISAVAADSGGGNTPTPTPSAWEWGSETGTADATWWAGLKTWVATATTSQLSACVGKTKSVTLTGSATSFSTTHTVRCIGYNCNRDISNVSKNTLTFIAVGGYCNYSTNTAFNWDQSIIRDRCNGYMSVFPGKASVATCSIGYSDWLSASHNGTVNYENSQCFAPSEVETGITNGLAASYSEFDKNNTSKKAYQYFSSDSIRAGLGQFWFRSMYYSNANYRLAMCASSGSSDAVGNFPNAGTSKVLNYSGNAYCAACFVI